MMLQDCWRWNLGRHGGKRADADGERRVLAVALSDGGGLALGLIVGVIVERIHKHLDDGPSR